MSIDEQREDDGGNVPAEPLILHPEQEVTFGQVRAIGQRMQRFMLEYEFALREVETKITILSDEFRRMHDYNPIEHVSSRVKTIDSLVEKLDRRGVPAELEAIREQITDIAGIRVTCSFVGDAYMLFDLLTRQEDVTVRIVKDYIAQPKPNGYKSLHAIVDIPVFLSTGKVLVPVEIQFRTIAMDFWASLEHKIYYKYDQDVPAALLAELKDAADVADALDTTMDRLHKRVRGADSAPG